MGLLVGVSFEYDCSKEGGSRIDAATITVRENGISGPFIYNMHYFTKTGSGQT